MIEALKELVSSAYKEAFSCVEEAKRLRDMCDHYDCWTHVHALEILALLQEADRSRQFARSIRKLVKEH